eukprot:1539676-Amphidinium_carterae.1
MSTLTGDLGVIASELEISEVTCDGGWELIVVRSKWPALKGPKGESFLAYSARKVALLKDLKRAGVDLPSSARGLTLLRDAKLSKTEQESVLFWTKGAYNEEIIIESLRRLERTGGMVSLPPSGGATAVFWNGEEDDVAGYEEEETAEVEDEDVTWWAGQGEEDVISEDQAQIILAQGYGAAPAPPRPSYGQSRLQSQQNRVQRGYVPPTNNSTQGGKQGQKGWTSKGKSKGKRDLASVIARTRCARCGVIGHWARSRTAPIGTNGGQQHYQSAERAAGAAGGSATAPSTHPQQAIFFTHGINRSSLCLSQTGAPAGLGLKRNEGVIN